jgi:hypothetical protein
VCVRGGGYGGKARGHEEKEMEVSERGTSHKTVYMETINFTPDEKVTLAFQRQGHLHLIRFPLRNQQVFYNPHALKSDSPWS